MELIKKHVDTVVILSGILISVLWMNNKFNSLEKDIAKLDKEIAVIKTVLLMKGILPNELCAVPPERTP